MGVLRFEMNYGLLRGGILFAVSHAQFVHVRRSDSLVSLYLFFFFRLPSFVVLPIAAGHVPYLLP